MNDFDWFEYWQFYLTSELGIRNMDIPCIYGDDDENVGLDGEFSIPMLESLVRVLKANKLAKEGTKFLESYRGLKIGDTCYYEDVEYKVIDLESNGVTVQPIKLHLG